MRHSWSILILLGSGCQSGEIGAPFPDTHPTELLLLFTDTQIEGYVLTPDQPRVDSPLLDELVTLEAWTYPEPPQSYGLAPGKLDLVVGGEGQLLPKPGSSYLGEVRDRRFEGWSSAAPSERAKNLRLPGQQFECLDQGGCYYSGLCERPCLPAPPDPPVRPRLPNLPACTLTLTATAAACDVWLAPCGEQIPVAGGGCVAPGTCVGPVAEAPPGWAHVRAGAPAGGDGSPGAPYATLTAAVQAGAQQLYLEAGEYEYSGTLTDAAWLGQCLGQVKVTVSGGLSLAGQVTTTNFYLQGDVTVDADWRAENMALEGDIEATTSSLSFAQVSLRRGKLVAGGSVLAGDRLRLDEYQAHFQGGRTYLERIALRASDGLSFAGQGAVARIEDLAATGGSMILRSTDSASVSASRVWVAGALGILQADVFSLVTLKDNVALNTEGIAIYLPHLFRDPKLSHPYNATVRAHRVYIDGGRDSAIWVGRALFVGTDLTLLNSRPREDGYYGRGLNIQEGGDAVVTRLHAAGHHSHAFRASWVSTFQLEHVYLADVIPGSIPLPASCPPSNVAHGAAIACEANGSISHFLIESAECGVFVDNDSPLVLRDGTIQVVKAGFCGRLPLPENMTGVRIRDHENVWVIQSSGVR